MKSGKKMKISSFSNSMRIRSHESKLKPAVKQIDANLQDNYTSRNSAISCRKEEKWNTMEQATSHIMRDDTYEQDLIRRRALIARQFLALSPYGSDEFWQCIEESQSKLALPLEVLVKCIRVAIRREDSRGKNRIFEMIFRRTQGANEYWSRQILLKLHLTSEEHYMCAHDLYADLCERVIRAVHDEKRQFWEENFQHCLSFERKHAYQAFMMHEGRWYQQHIDETPNTRRILDRA